MLFFRETVPDYRSALTPGELAAIRANVRWLVSIRQRGEPVHRGRANKNTVYPENMPNRYPGGGGETRPAAKGAEGTGPFDRTAAALRDAKKDGQVCLTDTHWSGLAAGGRSYPRHGRAGAARTASRGEGFHSGDLARMLGLGIPVEQGRYLPGDRCD